MTAKRSVLVSQLIFPIRSITGRWKGTHTNSKNLQVIDYSFGSCKMSTDGDKLKNGFFQLQANCRGQFGVSIEFTKLLNCNLEKSTTNNFQSYRGILEVSSSELVEYSTPIKKLWIPKTRKTNAYARLLIQLDRTKKVMTTLQTDHLFADLQVYLALSLNGQF